MPPTTVRRNSNVASSILPDNALAKKVLEEIERIDADAKKKKLAQMDSLQQAKNNILQRIRELQHQLGHIDKAMETINDGKAVRSKPEKRVRRDLEEVRGRVGRWMEGRKGQKFGAGDLAKEFSELEGVPVSMFLKPLVEAGTVKVDASEGNRRQKYFVSAE